MSGWAYLENHPVHYNDPLPDVAKIAEEEWSVLSHFCNLNEVVLQVSYDADYFQDQHILAAAWRQVWYVGGTWRSGALWKHPISKGLITIKLNPNVPNSWYADDGTCNTGYRFDMRTMIRHELLHGIGITSTIKEHSVGMEQSAGICALDEYDEQMHTAEGEPYLSGCSFTETRLSDAYVSDVQLFNPTTYMSGSSFHHTHDSGILYYAMRPGVCMQYDDNALAILNEIGAQCQPELLWFRHTRIGSLNSSNNGPTVNLWVYIMLAYVIKCLIVPSKI